MVEFLETYECRKNEIDDFLGLLEFLEKKEISKENGISKFDSFFHSRQEGEENISLSYQSMINIMKSNVSLMIYNIIEFTVTSLIDLIYEAIKRDGLSYINVNNSIQTLWRTSILKQANDPNANFQTFINKNQEIINSIVENRILELTARKTIDGGNLDGINIKQTFESHGIRIETRSLNYRPDILNTIKINRNNLAHGSVSFVEAVRQDGIRDIRDKQNFISNFLNELIVQVSDYIENKRYKQVV